jgi:hypothetical protein
MLPRNYDGEGAICSERTQTDRRNPEQGKRSGVPRERYSTPRGLDAFGPLG